MELDAKAVVYLLRSGGVFWGRYAYAARKLEVAQIQKQLALIDRHATKIQNAALYIRAMVEPDALLETWREAMVHLDGIQMYSEDAKKRAKKLHEMAKNPRVLEAWQTAAVGSETLENEVLTLLLLDGSEASLDALMPHFERALTDSDRLEQLEALQRYESSATVALFEMVRKALAGVRAASPVLALGEQLGLAAKGKFKLVVKLRATKPAKRFTYDVSTVSFDSETRPGFSLTRGQETQTASSWSSWQREVKCSLKGVPKALAKIAKEANLEWDFATATTKPIGAKKAAAMLEWLQGLR